MKIRKVYCMKKICSMAQGRTLMSVFTKEKKPSANGMVLLRKEMQKSYDLML